MLFLLFLGCQDEPQDSHKLPALQRHLEDFVPATQKWGFINKYGEKKIPAVYDDVRSFSGGVAAINSKGLWGYIDKSGNIVVPPQFIKAYGFENGHARVRFSNGLMGLIDGHADTILLPTYNEIFANQFNYYITQFDEKKGVIDRRGNVVFDPHYSDIKILYPNLFAVKEIDTYKLINKSGAVVLDGLTRVKSNGIVKQGYYWGFVDSIGNWTVRPRFESLQEGHGKYLIGREKNSVGLVNTISDEYQKINVNDMKYLGCQRYSILQDGKWKITNTSGDPVSDNEFDMIYACSENIIPIQINREWGYADIQGHVTVEPQFFLPLTSSEGLVRLFTQGGFGFHDHSGRVVIQPGFSDVRDFSEGMAAFQEW